MQKKKIYLSTCQLFHLSPGKNVFNTYVLSAQFWSDLGCPLETGISVIIIMQIAHSNSWVRSAFRLQTTLCSQEIISFWLRKNKIFGTLLPVVVYGLWYKGVHLQINYFHAHTGSKSYEMCFFYYDPTCTTSLAQPASRCLKLVGPTCTELLFSEGNPSIMASLPVAQRVH